MWPMMKGILSINTVSRQCEFREREMEFLGTLRGGKEVSTEELADKICRGLDIAMPLAKSDCCLHSVQAC